MHATRILLSNMTCQRLHAVATYHIKKIMSCDVMCVIQPKNIFFFLILNL